jgi:transcriptional regulator with XRE-family HTH domain
LLSICKILLNDKNEQRGCKIMENFNDVLSEVIQNIEDSPKTVETFAKKINISAAQLSRIKSGKAPLSDETIEKICVSFDSNREYSEELRTRLKRIQSISSLKNSIEASSADEHSKFFETGPDENRIICISYRDLPQTRDKGRKPEYIEKIVDIIKNSNLVIALFQSWGPLEEIKENLKEAINRDDIEAKMAWDYIHTLSLGVHEVFKATKKEMLKHGKSSEHIVLYEAKKVPPLVYCDVHSRLAYSEKLSPPNEKEKQEGKGRVRIVQLIMGKDANNIEKEYFIECVTDSAFQAVVATQFYPVLHFWRDTNGKLPVNQVELQKFVNKLSGGNKGVPWNIFTEST